jgi:hypothetical protein
MASLLSHSQWRGMMNLETMVPAVVELAMNHPCDNGPSRLAVAIALIREIADHVEDTNFGQLILKVIHAYEEDGA